MVALATKVRVTIYCAGLLSSVAGCIGNAPAPDEPPTATLGEAPPTLTRAAEASFQFSADRSDATFQCALDQGEHVACVSPHRVVVPDGPHRLEIVAVTPGGLRSRPLSVSWTVDSVPPEAAIVAGPPILSNTSEAAFGFISTEEGSFQCRLDGAAYTACTSGARFTQLSMGEHVFQVKAFDKAGNEDPTPASATWTVNLITPETVIGERPATPTASTSAMFSFDAAPGCTFACAVDEGAFSPCTSPRTLAGLVDGTHTFQVRATSADGVEDPTPASHTWIVDTIGPTTTITGGANGGFAGAAVRFTFVSESSATFECALDAGEFGACSSTTHQDYANLPSGLHAFYVRATDALNNLGPVASRGFTVDPDRPIVTFSHNDPSVRPSSPIWFEVSEPASVTCEVGGVELSPCYDEGDVVNPHHFYLPALNDGAYTITIRAIDAAGNVGTARRDITVDGTPPTLAIVSPVEDQLVASSVTFQFSANEPIASWWCRFDDAPNSHPCGATEWGSFPSGGEHTIHVYAHDLAGNESMVVRNFLVDSWAPQITISSPAAGETTPRSGSIVFSVTENAATSCKLSGETVFTPCTSPLAFTLPNGNRTVEILATDVVGNTAIATRTWNVFTPVPIVTITAPLQSSLTAGSVSFQFSADKPVSEYRCRLDDEPGYTSCTPGLTRTLSTGPHIMRIHAIDLAGIAGADAVRTWNVDADRTFVEIGITNTCLPFVGPDLTVPAGQTVALRFRNNSEDYPVLNLWWFRGGSSFGSLAPGASVAPNVTFCTVPGDDWVDISTSCSASPLRFFIHCLES